MKNVSNLNKKYNQYIINKLASLNDEKSELLIKDLEQIDFQKLGKLYDLTKQDISCKNDKIQAIENVCVKENINSEEAKRLEKIGEQVIKEGKYAVVTMAGGQGTRLGFNGPKGTYILDTSKGKISIFEILILNLKKAKEMYDVAIPWYIMTSKENNKATIDFFETNKYFDYGKENIHFFEQGQLPQLDMSGNVILDDFDRVRFASDGNGGVFKALNKNYLKQMKEKGIEYVYISGVDNILANFVDTIFIAKMKESKLSIGCKSVKKEYPEEKVGVICKRGNIPTVIEYTELPDNLKYSKKENGELEFSEANIVGNIFSIDVLAQECELPYHVATKMYKDMQTYKFETFIFDIYSYVDDLFVLRVKREEEFAPIKNKEGVDSPQTAIKLLEQKLK